LSSFFIFSLKNYISILVVVVVVVVQLKTLIVKNGVLEDPSFHNQKEATQIYTFVQ
jgi:hypothetical protein